MWRAGGWAVPRGVRGRAGKVSEHGRDRLVSNALRHGTPPRQVRLKRRPGWLRIEVDDSCVDEACPRPPADDGGRGLALIESCAMVWGQQQHRTGKTVWAELTSVAHPRGVVAE